MAVIEDTPCLLIARDASDLAFRIGQAVQKAVIENAIRRAGSRKMGVVCVEDVEAAATGIDMLAACHAAWVAKDDLATDGGSSAA